MRERKRELVRERERKNDRQRFGGPLGRGRYSIVIYSYNV